MQADRSVLTDMRRLVTPLLILMMISGCSSTALVDEHETYRGPVGAAVLPVGGAVLNVIGHDQGLGQQIQRLIQQNLEASGLFAHVERLSAASSANEAEVIIKPILLELRWQGPGYRRGDIRLRIKATQKSDRRVILDKTYKGSCSNCKALGGAPPVAGPMEKPLRKLQKDLRRKLD